ncbi:MAG: hypothetical protein R6X34_27595 [Chloroflexota bacterium]
MRKFSPCLVLVCLLGLVLVTAVITSITVPSRNISHAAPAASDEYIVLSWNDLGMHWYTADFQDFAMFPPSNTLFAQVIKIGDPPEIITSGITVTYAFPDNTYSVGKTNFWDYEQAIFGVDLEPDVGLHGKGLAGEMDPQADHFIAEGIPLTEFSDSDLNNPDPYQLALVKVYDAASGEELAQSNVVAPTSTEVSCADCHYDNGVDGISTGRVETNILELHDVRNKNKYPAGHKTPLMDRRPILCAECHESSALGEPGLPNMDNLSFVMHSSHDRGVYIPDTMMGCYMCHPGPETQSLRDTMFSAGEDCIDCHGTLADVSQNPTPWLREPRCDDCHDDDNHDQDQALFHLSKNHGGLYCAACHDSAHATAPSSEPLDNIKFIDLQGDAGTLTECTVCHATPPEEAGPHGLMATIWEYVFLPMITR